KDMTSTIGSIDIYQNRNSNVARFVVQLRQGAAEPLVQPEGNSLLVLGTPNASGQSLANGGGEEYSEEEIGLMSSTSIDDFLLNNNKFYGRKISIETTDMDIRDILKFISEESGINMVFDENITGKMSLKLRKIPWDQALITVLKSKKLGFRRQGQVLRIASIETLLDEEETAVRIKEGRLRLEPLVVKNFHINYTNISNLEQKVRDFIKEADQVVENEGQNGGGGRNPTVVNNTRGKVTADAMTNTLIVTDTPTNLARVEKLIQLLDVQPQQVLIEGRVIEASESYSRAIGVNFGLNTGSLGADNPLTIPGSTRAVTNLGNTRGSKNPINISPSATFTPAVTGALSASMWLGRFGAFGDLATRLALDETENKVKILSSPRIAVLHNNSATIKQGSIIQVPDTSSQGTGTGTVTQTFKDVEVGVNLSVKPLITNVGTVNLDLSIEKSAVAGAGERTSRNAKTNIIVKNGETAVIGGVFTSDVNTTRSGIPGLKDIPVLGTLFRTDGDSKGKTELMFFISPQILPSLDVPLMKASGEDEPGSVN
ncbi:MAG: type IV pilus secretin PilQ, partial [Pseudobdellovibrio sp.]